ncbi:MAG: hypothetical protein BWZ07_02712 [Alphaproteobacteria bacterium ADurb.BinA280]|nr:MAG: hypothetical protein BWZ07_02712 [Alphaproteobacteria bacterium ADurb.BinA280]
MIPPEKHRIGYGHRRAVHGQVADLYHLVVDGRRLIIGRHTSRDRHLDQAQISLDLDQERATKHGWAGDSQRLLCVVAANGFRVADAPQRDILMFLKSLTDSEVHFAAVAPLRSRVILGKNGAIQRVIGNGRNATAYFFCIAGEHDIARCRTGALWTLAKLDRQKHRRAFVGGRDGH